MQIFFCIVSYCTLSRVQDYKEDEDPTRFKSSKTGRGPLSSGWEKSVSPVMCIYKLITVEFKWWGIQSRVEEYIQKVSQSLFYLSHVQLVQSL